jgi:cytochrome c biogenesis protein CcdA
MSNKLKLVFVVLAVVAILFYLGRFYYAGDKHLLSLIFTAALVDSINPCAISILVITVAFLFSLGRTRYHVLLTGGAYILAIFLVYILIGLGILKVLSFLNIPHFVAKVGAFVMILMGVFEIIGQYFPKFPIKLEIPQSTHSQIARVMQKASIPAALAMGALVGMYEFPCTGGPYLTVLGLLHDSQTFISGFVYLIFYNLIFVLPLVIILVIASDRKLADKMDKWKKESRNTKLFMGLLMIILGLIILVL